MDVKQAIHERRSVKKYQEGVSVPDAVLAELFDDVRLAPSSFDIQHWSFVVVREAANKQTLQEVAYNQPQVGACSAAIIVVADPEAWRHGPGYWRQSNVPDAMVERYEQMIPGFYQNDPQKARDEALRSVGLVAMTLMLRAWEMGYATGPMIGFDPDGVAQRFGIEPPKFPAMLIVLGKPAEDAMKHPRPYRRPVSELVKLEAANGRGLTGE